MTDALEDDLPVCFHLAQQKHVLLYHLNGNVSSTKRAWLLKWIRDDTLIGFIPVTPKTHL